MVNKNTMMMMMIMLLNDYRWLLFVKGLHVWWKLWLVYFSNECYALCHFLCVFLMWSLCCWFSFGETGEALSWNSKTGSKWDWWSAIICRRREAWLWLVCYSNLAWSQVSVFNLVNKTKKSCFRENRQNKLGMWQ